MLDPFTALSTASAIVQFLQFGTNIIQKSYEIHKSSNGSIAALKELQDGVLRLQKASDNLATITEKCEDPDGMPVIIDTDTGDLLNACSSLADEILTVLRELTPANPAKRWHSVRLALRIERRKDELEGYERSLDHLRKEVMERMLIGTYVFGSLMSARVM